LITIPRLFSSNNAHIKRYFGKKYFAFLFYEWDTFDKFTLSVPEKANFSEKVD